jgi:phage gp29-like protein
MLSVSKRAAAPRVSFSPVGYRQAKRQYEQGHPDRLIRMMQEASLDSHAQGCLLGRRAGIKKSYTLRPYEGQTLPQERIDFFRGVLQGLQLRDLLEAIQEGRFYLFNVIDFAWEVIDGHQVPVRFEDFDQHHFRRSEDGEIILKRGLSTEPIPDTALVVEARRTPIMLPVLRDYILKEFGLESWASFLETFGEPFIMAKYPPGADDDFKKEVDEGLDAMASSSRGRAPHGTDLEIHEAGRGTGDHVDFTGRADTGISITLLGHANAVQDRGGVNVGGRQQSFEVRQAVAVDDMHFVEPYVNRLLQLVGQRNFGDGRVPRFELDKSKPVDAKEHAEILDIAWRHGNEIHVSEYEKLGIRVRTDEEWIQRSPGRGMMLD